MNLIHHSYSEDIAIEIQLSNTTKILVNQLKKTQTIEMPDVFLLEGLGSIKFIELVIWLKKKHKGDNKTNFLLESLYAALLKDIEEALFANHQEPGKKNAFWSVHLKSISLAIAGAIFFGCEGFDGVFAMFGVCSLPAIVFFSSGLIFSLLSLMVLYAFELIEISKSMGIEVKNVPEILDIYIKEVESIKAIRKKINVMYIRHVSSKALEEDLVMLQLLILRYESLDEAREKLSKLKNNSTLIIAKYAAAAVTGLIFFSGGFFAGQTVALELSGLFIATVSPAFWPVILASIVVGLAAFSVYWFIELPEMEHVISRWIGLDQKIIDDLCNDVAVEEQKEKLAALEQNIKLAAARIDRVTLLEASKQELHLKNEELISLRGVLNAQPELSAQVQKVDSVAPTLLFFDNSPEGADLIKPFNSCALQTTLDSDIPSFASNPYCFHQPFSQVHPLSPGMETPHLNW